MIEREITTCLTRLFRQYPIVTVTGPRQSGKTTLCRSTFPDLEFANLEAPDLRDFAESDPRGFLSQLGEGAILDEIQHVPQLLSYLQVLADEKGRNGLFVLTGSEQFKLSDAISQSLAGRTALLRLLPLSMAERRRMGASEDVDDILFSGFYPRIFDQGLDPRQALGDYFETYVERDVRRLGGIRNLPAFRRFVRLCAGRVGQLVNVTALGSDAGVSHTTAREWLAVLERSYIIFPMRPYYANIRRRLVKSPKLYFFDVGLASYLIGIENAGQIATHPLRGALFENAAIVEALKHGFNRGHQPDLSFFRDARGLECDLLYRTGRGIGAIEIKSGSTVVSDYFRSLNRIAELVPDVTFKAVVYGGEARQSRSDCEVVPLADLGGVLNRFEVEQELAAFVEEKKGSEPPDNDVRTLDTAYAEHVQPTLEGLATALIPSVAGLFRTYAMLSMIAFGQGHFTKGGLPSAEWNFQMRHWGDTKQRFIDRPGFKLRDGLPLGLWYKYEFRSYTGAGRADFDLVLSIAWQFFGKHFERAATVNGKPVSALDSTTTYREMEDSNAGVDLVVAGVGEAVMTQIQMLSSR